MFVKASDTALISSSKKYRIIHCARLAQVLEINLKLKWRLVFKKRRKTVAKIVTLFYTTLAVHYLQPSTCHQKTGEINALLTVPLPFLFGQYILIDIKN